MKGKFIVFEGIEGTGKTTQINRLNEFLQEKGVVTYLTKEPGGTPLGKHIRQILQNEITEAPSSMAEILLFLADRAHHVSNYIKPALERDEWVLCDRFEESTFAYQGHGRGLDLAELIELNNFATNGLTANLTILLDIRVDISLSRLAGRGNELDRIEREKRDFHERIRNGYLERAESFTDGSHVIINAEAHLDVVYQEVLRSIERFF